MNLNTHLRGLCNACHSLNRSGGRRQEHQLNAVLVARLAHNVGLLEGDVGDQKAYKFESGSLTCQNILNSGQHACIFIVVRAPNLPEAPAAWICCMNLSIPRLMMGL